MSTLMDLYNSHSKGAFHTNSHPRPDGRCSPAAYFWCHQFYFYNKEGDLIDTMKGQNMTSEQFEKYKDYIFKQSHIGSDYTHYYWYVEPGGESEELVETTRSTNKPTHEPSQIPEKENGITRMALIFETVDYRKAFINEFNEKFPGNKCYEEPDPTSCNLYVDIPGFLMEEVVQLWADVRAKCKQSDIDRYTQYLEEYKKKDAHKNDDKLYIRINDSRKRASLILRFSSEDVQKEFIERFKQGCPSYNIHPWTFKDLIVSVISVPDEEAAYVQGRCMMILGQMKIDTDE